MLKKIVEYKSLELDHHRRKTPLKDIKLMAKDLEPPVKFLKNFSDTDLDVIAEIKKASPSAGLLQPDYATNFDPVKIAHAYVENGAKALSVLTDENFFQGSLKNLESVKSAVGLPVLRKDFTLGEYHIYQGRAHGADAILLIAAILDLYQLKDYHDLILELGMTPLIEIHAADEIKKISVFSPRFVGINNRDLETLKVDVAVTEKLLPEISWPATVISESGLKHHETLVNFRSKGVRGFLIGENLLQGDPGENLRKILQL